MISLNIPEFGNETSLCHESGLSLPDHLPNDGSHYEEVVWVQDYRPCWNTIICDPTPCENHSLTSTYCRYQARSFSSIFEVWNMYTLPGCVASPLGLCDYGVTNRRLYKKLNLKTMQRWQRPDNMLILQGYFLACKCSVLRTANVMTTLRLLHVS